MEVWTRYNGIPTINLNVILLLRRLFVSSQIRQLRLDGDCFFPYIYGPLSFLSPALSYHIYWVLLTWKSRYLEPWVSSISLTLQTYLPHE